MFLLQTNMNREEMWKRWEVMQKVEDGRQQNWKWDHMIKSSSKIEKWKDWKVTNYGLGVLIGKTENGPHDQIYCKDFTPLHNIWTFLHENRTNLPPHTHITCIQYQIYKSILNVSQNKITFECCKYHTLIYPTFIETCKHH